MGSSSRFTRTLAAVALCMCSAAAPDGDGVRLTVDAALERAFPGAEVTRTRHVLTAAQSGAIAKTSGDADYTSKVAFLYTARDTAGKVLGHAYFDGHVVRTKRETVMLVVSPERELREVVLLAFLEPPEYVPPAKWYTQFVGRKLDADLRIGGKVDACTGATLTSRATTLAARRALALHDELVPKPEPAPAPRPEPAPAPEPAPQPAPAPVPQPAPEPAVPPEGPPKPAPAPRPAPRRNLGVVTSARAVLRGPRLRASSRGRGLRGRPGAGIGRGREPGPRSLASSTSGSAHSPQRGSCSSCSYTCSAAARFRRTRCSPWSTPAATPGRTKRVTCTSWPRRSRSSPSARPGSATLCRASAADGRRGGALAGCSSSLQRRSPTPASRCSSSESPPRARRGRSSTPALGVLVVAAFVCHLFARRRPEGGARRTTETG
jgi:hypothetical protein